MSLTIDRKINKIVKQLAQALSRVIVQRGLLDAPSSTATTKGKTGKKAAEVRKKFTKKTAKKVAKKAARKTVKKVREPVTETETVAKPVEPEVRVAVPPESTEQQPASTGT